MIIATYATDYAPIVGNCLTTLGLVGLLLTAYQIRGARLWNKLNAAFSFLPNPLELENIEAELDQTIGFWRKDAPIDEKLAKAFTGDLDDKEYSFYALTDEKPEQTKERMLAIGRKLKLYVNLLEMYCIAINAGVVDEEVAFHIYRFKFAKHNRKLTKYVEHIRRKHNDDSIYCEFTAHINKWETRKGTKKRF